MEIYLNIAPRQSGKTTKLVKEFMNFKPQNSVIITHCGFSAVHLTKKYGLTFNEDVYSAKSFVTKTIGKDIKKIYVDEWLFFKPEEQQYIYQYAEAHNIDLICYSTPNKLYDRQLFDTAKDFAYSDMKNGTNHLDNFVDLFPGLKGLKESLLIHPMAKITHTQVTRNFVCELEYHRIPDRCKMELEGKYIN